MNAKDSWQKFFVELGLIILLFGGGFLLCIGSGIHAWVIGLGLVLFSFIWGTWMDIIERIEKLEAAIQHITRE